LPNAQTGIQFDHILFKKRLAKKLRNFNSLWEKQIKRHLNKGISLFTLRGIVHQQYEKNGRRIVYEVRSETKRANIHTTGPNNDKDSRKNPNSIRVALLANSEMLTKETLKGQVSALWL